MPRASNFGKGVNTTVKTSVEIPEELWRAMKARALNEDKNLAELIADALRLFLATKKETKRER